MSRSYKKQLIGKDKNSKVCKKSAVRIIRHSKSVANGSSFKKYYCSWNISDYKSHCTEDEWFNIWKHSDYLKKHLPDAKSAYRYWLKCYRNK